MQYCLNQQNNMKVKCNANLAKTYLLGTYTVTYLSSSYQNITRPLNVSFSGKLSECTDSYKFRY